MRFREEMSFSEPLSPETFRSCSICLCVTSSLFVTSARRLVLSASTAWSVWILVVVYFETLATTRFETSLAAMTSFAGAVPSTLTSSSGVPTRCGSRTMWSLTRLSFMPDFVAIRCRIASFSIRPEASPICVAVFVTESVVPGANGSPR